jgi:hypothetical protein
LGEIYWSSRFISLENELFIRMEIQLEVEIVHLIELLVLIWQVSKLVCTHLGLLHRWRNSKRNLVSLLNISLKRQHVSLASSVCYTHTLTLTCHVLYCCHSMKETPLFPLISTFSLLHCSICCPRFVIRINSISVDCFEEAQRCGEQRFGIVVFHVDCREHWNKVQNAGDNNPMLEII